MHAASGPAGMVAFGDAVVGVCCRGSQGYFSADGVHWSPIPDSTTFDSATHGAPQVIAWHGGYVAVGSGVANFSKTPIIPQVFEWTSADGLHWSSVPLAPAMASAAGSDYGMGAAVDALGVFGNTLLAAITTRGVPSTTSIWRSTDGRHWQGRVGDPGFTRSNIAAFVTMHGTLVALGQMLGEGAAWVSSDGVMWRSTLTGAKVAMSTDAAVGSQLLMLGVNPQNSAIAFVSNDGEHWLERQTTGIAPDPSAPGIQLLGADRGLFVASDCGPSVRLCASADGVNWRRVSDGSGVFADNQWGAVGLGTLAVAPSGSAVILGGVPIQPGSTAFFEPTAWVAK